MREHRVHERFTPTNPIVAVNRSNGQPLGQVANISAGGFMLMVYGDCPMEGGVFHIGLLPEPTNPRSEIEVGAICLWHSETRASDASWCGFQIIDISDGAQYRLTKLLETMHPAD